MKRNKAHSHNYWAFWCIQLDRAFCHKYSQNALFISSSQFTGPYFKPHQLTLSFVIRVMDNNSLRVKQ